VSAPLPRLVHPAAWWLWAIGLALAGMRTDNPLLLIVIAAVAGLVVSTRRVRAPWAQSFALMAGLGLVTVALSVLLQILLGVRLPGHVLFRLPSIGLPSWAEGLSVGGPVTGEAVLNSAVTGLRLAVLIACFGAANSLAHPARLLRIMPAALYEMGVAVVVAITFVPQLAQSAVRVRKAQRLRGRSVRGLRGVHRLLVPILEEGLENAIMLAASMDSRGYGRRAAVPRALRRVTNALVLIGLVAACVGTYSIVDPNAAHTRGVVILGAGTGIALVGSFLAGRRVLRSRFQPDRWLGAEWLVTGCGAIAAVTFYVAVPNGVDTSVPFAWPTLPVWPFLGILVAAIPAFATPEPPSGVRTAAIAQPVPVPNR
jgi:energy-coupling factor transport system permease protein